MLFRVLAAARPRAPLLCLLLGSALALLAGVRWLSARPMTYAAFEAREAQALAAEAVDEPPAEPSEEPPGDEGERIEAEPLALSEAEGRASADEASESDGAEEAEEPSEGAPTMPYVPLLEAQPRRAPDFDDVLSVLLIGVDRTRGEWGRADTIVVAIFDRDSGHAGLVSIPRDLYVPVPRHGHARINAALRIAARQGGDPLEVLSELVGEVLQVNIDHVIIGNLNAFEQTVDALGGLEVDVPCPIVDDFRDGRTESGRRILRVAAGRQRMDGATAAMYARSRHGRSDWDRSRRQHAILSALRRRIGELGVTEWLPVVGSALDAGVITDMSRLELLSLVRRARRLSPRRLHGMLLGSRQTSHHRTSEGRSVLLPDYDAIDDAMQSLFEAPPPGRAPRRRRCRPTDAALQHARRPRRRADAPSAQPEETTEEAPSASTDEDPAPGRSAATGDTD